MPRYKAVDRSPKFLPVILDEQIQPGSFEFALDYLIDHELDLSALHDRFNNDETGAPAYDPAVMLKIVLLAYSRGMVSSRSIERACRQNVLFMAISGDNAPQFTTIARFVRELGDQITQLFTQIVLICDEQGLIGKEMFAVDGMKLPGNASKQHSGTHEQLEREAARMEAALREMVQAHRQADVSDSPDDQRRREDRITRLRNGAKRYRQFLSTHQERRGVSGQPLKSNVTDNDSAKMAGSSGVIQGYTGIAVVDSAHQVIVGAMAHGSGSEQSALIPAIEASNPVRDDQTLITADSGFHSETNLRQLYESNTPALIADHQMRHRDPRFAGQKRHRAKPKPLALKRKPNEAPPTKRFTPKNFVYDESTNSAICPAGKRLYSSGSQTSRRGFKAHQFKGTKRDCVPCGLREQCLRHPERTPIRQVAFFEKGQPSNLPLTRIMKQAIDSARGKLLYARRIGTVEPVFGNLRYNKKLTRLTLRSKAKVNTQWQLYCLVHNIEKLRHGFAT